MNSDQRLMMEPANVSNLAEPATSATVVKTILVYMIDDDLHDQRINTALTLARAHSAHLSCLHVIPIEAYVAFDGFGGVFAMNDIISKLDERAAAFRAKVEARLEGEDVSWDFEQATGNVATKLLGRAALADLVVTTREHTKKDFVGPTIGFLGDLLQSSRTPLFIPSSDGGTLDPCGPALIAWNGSFEAANAVRASLGLLRLSKEVRVIHVQEKSLDPKAFPRTRLLEYLSRQGIHAELVAKPSPTGDVEYDIVSAMIVAQATGAGASYIVMGGYSHTRFAEYVFGGVTRTLLQDCPVSLVLSS